MKKVLAAEAADIANEKAEQAEPDKQARHEAVFTAAQLRPDARALFGVSQSTYDGATNGIGPDETFTVNAMREHINKWLKEVH
jgi:hypothetical protein